MSVQPRAPLWAIVVSLLLHGLVLLIPRQDPSGEGAGPLQARLAPRAAAKAKPEPQAPAKPAKAGQVKAHSRVIAVQRGGGPPVAASPEPRFSAAEKAEMNNFLDELARAPQPTLAQRSLGMAREHGREMAHQDDSGTATLEARPNGPPVNPFSLEMYLDALVRRLNSSAGFVKNDPRSKGVHPAAVQFRLNPDGSLKSFVVLNAGDQADEIAFIKSVVERSIPFSPFPPDIDKAARSLGVIICILPGSGSGGFGFSRGSGRGC